MQRELIETALSGKSCVGILPTGSGKSLCYQIPAVLLRKLTIVVSPLIALMRDQVDGLERLGISCARYDSSLPAEEKEAVLQNIAAGKLSMLFVAPESLSSSVLQQATEGVELGLFVIDEAHCVSEWGHSFRPDYLGLPDYTRSHSFHAVMALTATATVKVRNDLAAIFGVEDDHVFYLPPTRENISRRVLGLDPAGKMQKLVSLLQSSSSVPAIVYAGTRKDTEELSAMLSQQGISCKSYHAGMPTDVRGKVQDEFLSGDVSVLVATIAFGMGIDKPDVRTVVHYHLPSSIESYVQESGRAGRDGLPSESIVFYHARDVVAARNRIKASVPDSFSLEMLLKRLLTKGDNVVSFYGTTTECDVSEHVLGRVLFDLERDGLIRTLAKGYQYYKVKALFPLPTILAGRDERETGMLTWLSENADGEIMDLAINSDLTWEEALAWLEDLMNSGEWQVTFRQRAVLIRSQGDSRSVENKLEEYGKRLLRQRDDDELRLEAGLQIFKEQKCLTNALDEYFGFPREVPCGYCGVCTGDNQTGSDEASSMADISDELFAQISDLVKENRPSLVRAGQLTRFLLGFLGPAAMRGRLWNQPLYGSLSDHPWDEIYALSFALLGK